MRPVPIYPNAIRIDTMVGRSGGVLSENHNIRSGDIMVGALTRLVF